MKERRERVEKGGERKKGRDMIGEREKRESVEKGGERDKRKKGRKRRRVRK